MQILLMCAHEYGSVSFPVQWIDGHHVPARRYEIRSHQVILDNGLAEPILHHDAEELLRNPLYRMPTPAEQEQFVKARDQSMTAQEEEAEARYRALTIQGQESIVVTGINQHGQSVSEMTVLPEEEQELTEDVEQEQEAETPDAPSAVQKRKYTRKK